METRYNSSARVQPTEGRYLAHPGTCAVCMKVPENIDEVFGNPVIELEQYGYLYFCQACCFEIGSFVMMIAKPEHDMALEAGHALQLALNSARNENAYLRGLLDARISAAGNGYESSDGPADVPVLKAESDATDLDSIIDEYEPKSA